MVFIERLLYAKILVDVGDLVAAELEVADELDVHPDNLDALSLLAKIKHMRGELSAAVACWAQIHSESPTSEQARMHLLSMLHLAQDPEKGVGEFLALGQHQLVRKPSLYLALDEAFGLFVARKPDEARKKCQQVADRMVTKDREVYKLAVIADAWISDLSGDLETACSTLERLGRERGMENDFDRLIALVGLYERIGTPTRLEAAVNICSFLERVMDPMPVLGRLAVLHRRLEQPDAASDYEQRHLREFRRGMHHVSVEEASRVAARQYIPLQKLSQVVFSETTAPAASDVRETGIALALAGDTEGAEQRFREIGKSLDRHYVADLADMAGHHQRALDLYVELLSEDCCDLEVAGWVLDAITHQNISSDAGSPSGLNTDAARGLLAGSATGACVRELLEQRIEIAPTQALSWRRLATLLALHSTSRERAQECAVRALAYEEAENLRANPVGRVLAAAVYHFVGKAKGLIHEVWAGRQSSRPGEGGNLSNDHILGNLTPEMKNNVRNTFFAVREYARAKFPHLTGDILDYNYTYKVTKEDEPSGGTSAGLPTGLAFLSVFLQRPVPQSIASTGWLVADAHDVLVLRNVGETEYKLRAAYHRNLQRLIVPRGNRAELESSPLVPRPICDELVAYASDIDGAVRVAFGQDIFN